MIWIVRTSTNWSYVSVSLWCPLKTWLVSWRPWRIVNKMGTQFRGNREVENWLNIDESCTYYDILRMNTYDRSIWHMIQVIQSNYLLWAICFIMFSATWNIDFLNCTCTLLEDGTKGSQSVAKLKTWVLSPKSDCESLFKLEIWRVLEVLSDWAGTCKVFSQVSPITFSFEELLSNVYQNLENFRSDRRQLMLDVDIRDILGNRKKQGADQSSITAWKCESEMSDITKMSLLSFPLKLGNLFFTETTGKDSHWPADWYSTSSREWSSQNDIDLVSFSP